MLFDIILSRKLAIPALTNENSKSKPESSAKEDVENNA